jgi:hypothetical protein
MPKGRKTGSNASKLTKLIRTTLIEKKNAPPTSENIQPKKEKPKVKEEPEDPCNIIEESFGSQARRLMAIVRYFAFKLVFNCSCLGQGNA